MKTKVLKTVLMSFALAAVLGACKDNDEYYYVTPGGGWLSYGNLEKIDNGGYSKYAIRRDDGSRLILTDGIGINSSEASEDMRVYAYYSILGSERDELGLEGHMNYYIRLFGIDDVLTKTPVKQSFINANEEVRLDSIGNDPINVSEAWFGGKYLNVEFYIPVKENSSTSHFINLVQEDVVAHGDTVYVTLRHNAYDDKPAAGENPNGKSFDWVWGNVSFDLTSLIPEGKTSVPVKLIWTAYKENSSDTKTLEDSGLFTLDAQTKAVVRGELNKSLSDKEGKTAPKCGVAYQ